MKLGDFLLCNIFSGTASNYGIWMLSHTALQFRIFDMFQHIFNNKYAFTNYNTPGSYGSFSNFY